MSSLATRQCRGKERKINKNTHFLKLKTFLNEIVLFQERKLLTVNKIWIFLNSEAIFFSSKYYFNEHNTSLPCPIQLTSNSSSSSLFLFPSFVLFSVSSVDFKSEARISVSPNWTTSTKARYMKMYCFWKTSHEMSEKIREDSKNCNFSSAFVTYLLSTPDVSSSIPGEETKKKEVLWLIFTGAPQPFEENE